MATKVINYFYRPVKNLDLNLVEFCDVYQILSDGTNVSSLYGLIDDKSFMSLCEAAFLKASQYRTSLYEREFIDTFKLCFSPTSEYLKNSDNFKRLIKYLDSVNLRTKDTVLFFDVSDVFGKGDFFVKNLKHLKSYGLQVCLGGFGNDINLIDVFAEPFFDYFRVSAKYVSNVTNLSLLYEACSKNGVKLIVEGVDKISDFRAVRAGKVSLVAGDAVCRSVEEVDRKTLGLKPLTSAEADRFAYRLSREKIAQEQNLLLRDGKKLLKRARHDFNYETGEFIIASSRQNAPVVEKAPSVDESETARLLKQGKLPKPKDIKLDESGNEMREEYNDSIIESLYALVADKSVLDKERAIKAEILRQKALREEEERKARIAETKKARIQAELAEKKRILPNLIYALESRIDYLIDLDRIRVELDALVEKEIIELLEQERIESEKLEKQKREAEKEKLAAKAYAQIQQVELNKKQEEEIARLKAELEEAKKLKEERTALREENAAPKKIRKPLDLGEYVPATIEEEVPAFLEDDFYIATIDDSEFLQSEIYTPKKKLSKKERKAEEKRREIEKTLVYDEPVQRAYSAKSEEYNDALGRTGVSGGAEADGTTADISALHNATADNGAEQTLPPKTVATAKEPVFEAVLSSEDEGQCQATVGYYEQEPDADTEGIEETEAMGEPQATEENEVTAAIEAIEETEDKTKTDNDKDDIVRESEYADVAEGDGLDVQSADNDNNETGASAIENGEGALQGGEHDWQVRAHGDIIVAHQNGLAEDGIASDGERIGADGLNGTETAVGEKIATEAEGEPGIEDERPDSAESADGDTGESEDIENQTEVESAGVRFDDERTDEGAENSSDGEALSEQTEQPSDEGNGESEQDEKAEQKKRVFDGGYDIDKDYDDGDGHYDDDFKWIDSEGEEYNGYFAKNGNWIDYGYFDSADEWHDNGYRDEDGVWIPDGYFNDDGDFVKI